MENEQTVQRPKVKRGPALEGPKNHYITFGVSIVLSLLAFMAAANESLNPKFVIFLLVAMAAVQALFQILYWMHLKDRGHFFPFLFIFMGTIVTLLAFASVF